MLFDKILILSNDAFTTSVVAIENYIMEKDFEPLKARLRIICDRLDEDEQQYFRPLIDNFKGHTQEFQRIMRDLGKFGEKISDGSKFKVYSEVQHLFDDAFRKES